jgi:hypothetical protein
LGTNKDWLENFVHLFGKGLGCLLPSCGFFRDSGDTKEAQRFISGLLVSAIKLTL